MNDPPLKNCNGSNRHSSMMMLAAPLLVLAFILLAVRPLWDPDLWWHLATGREIVEKMQLPIGDLFNFTRASDISPTYIFLLKGYWLAQVVWYLAYKLAGEIGLIVVRAVTLALIPALVLLSCRRWRVAPSVSLILAMLCGWLTLYYTGERPQLFSFLFVTILFILLEEIGYAEKDPVSGGYRHCIFWGWGVPVLMLLWANMHPGFMLGVGLIGAYVCLEFVKIVLLKYPVDRGRFLAVAGLLLFGMLLTLLNPNGVAPFKAILSFHRATTEQQLGSEYLSPWTIYRTMRYIVYPYWLYLPLICGVLLASWRKTDITRLVIIGGLIFLSLQAYRFIPFLVFGTVVYCGRAITCRLPSGRLPARLVGGIAAVGIGILLVNALLLQGPAAIKTLRGPLVSTQTYPEGAVQFIQRERPVGEMFNDFNWGGYLEWRLFPAYRTFIDGRNLRPAVFDDYRVILWIEDAWRQLLDKHRINMVVLSPVDDFTGELYELTNFLYQADDWQLVYADATAVILLRGAENSNIIARHSLPKERIYRHVLDRVAALQQRGIRNVNTWQALATAYSRLGQHDQAATARSMVTKFR
jgi:hypothetical protein